MVIDKLKEYYFIVSVFVGKKDKISKQIKCRCYILNSNEHASTIEYFCLATDKKLIMEIENEKLIPL